MQGTLVIIRTRYAWNIENNGDQACLERWSHWGPRMPGTLVILGTSHAWNGSRWGLDMPGTFENFRTRILRTPYTWGRIWFDQNSHFSVAHNFHRTSRFFGIFLVYKPSISQSPCSLASRGTWNLKIIESPLIVKSVFFRSSCKKGSNVVISHPTQTPSFVSISIFILTYEVFFEHVQLLTFEFFYNFFHLSQAQLFQIHLYRLPGSTHPQVKRLFTQKRLISYFWTLNIKD